MSPLSAHGAASLVHCAASPTARGLVRQVRYPWTSIDQVCAWLAEQGLTQLQQGFRSQSINGEVLLTLVRNDLECLGVTTLGGKATLIKKIEVAKKQHYAGQVVGVGGGNQDGGSTSTTGGGASLSTEQQRLVLEQVLQENAELAARLATSRETQNQGGATAAPPDNFRCPITTEVMQDPVFSMDGHTYEREAIETWSDLLRVTQHCPYCCLCAFLLPFFKGFLNNFFCHLLIDADPTVWDDSM